MYKKIMASLVAMFVAMLGLVVIASPAVGDEDCTPKDAYTEIVVDTPAYTETVEHPAETHIVHHDAVTHVVHHDAVVGPWWNWSPNNSTGPQDYEPAFPTDERGTWQGPHTEGGPDQTAEGTYNVSHGNSGNSSWFHRGPGKAAYDETVVDHEAYDETVVDKEAWTETIEHPAVTHEVKHDAVTCDEVVVPPNTPKPPKVETPKPPTVDTPKVDKPVAAPKPPRAAPPVAVPTVVDAGLASLPNTGASDYTGLIALVAGMMILVGAVLFMRYRA